jgi:hypothetical protein
MRWRGWRGREESMSLPHSALPNAKNAFHRGRNVPSGDAQQAGSILTSLAHPVSLQLENSTAGESAAQ